MSYTQLVRLDTEVKKLLDGLVENKKETYSDIIRRLAEQYTREVKLDA